MDRFRWIFKFYIDSSVHVALAVLALVYITNIEYDLTFSLPFILFVFFGAITGYNLVKYAAIAGLHHRTLTNSLKSIQILSFISAMAFIYFGTLMSIKTIFVTGIFGILTLFYALPFFKGRNLRAFTGFKIFIVGLVWAGVTVIDPLVNDNLTLTQDHWLTFGQRCFIVIALTLPFEIRDLPYDSRSLQTMPQKLGIVGAKRIGFILLGVVILMELIKTQINLNHTIGLIFLSIVLGIFLLRTQQKQSKYFASFWVEAIPIFWCLFYWLVVHFF